MAIPPIAALEIGTTRTVVLVGELDQARRVRIIGKGVYPTTGVHKGQVVDLQHARSGVEMAVKQASEESQVDIGRVVMAVSGGHVEATQNQASVAVMARDRIVTREDVEEVTERVKEIQLPDGREVMHTITQNFSLDGQSGIVKPEGLQGSQLLLNMLLIHARRAPVENMRSVAVAAELDVDDVVFSGLCSALAVLTPDQKRNGVVVIDLGGGTTNYLAYAGNVMAAAGSIAVGGEHVTNDLVLAFNILQMRAEERHHQPFGGAAAHFRSKRLGQAGPVHLPQGVPYRNQRPHGRDAPDHPLAPPRRGSSRQTWRRRRLHRRRRGHARHLRARPVRLRRSVLGWRTVGVQPSSGLCPKPPRLRHGNRSHPVWNTNLP